MLIPVLALIVVLTCALATSVYLNVRQFTSHQTVLAAANHEVVSSTHAAAQFIGDQAKTVRTIQADHAKQLQSMSASYMEQLRLTLADNSTQMREAVKVAWMPVDQSTSSGRSGGPLDQPAWSLPTPLAADAKLYDDGDPTDNLINESALGRHDGAVMANDEELIKDGNYLGIPGLVPPPGVVDEASRVMLLRQAEQLGIRDIGGTMLGIQPSVPPGTIPTPTLQFGTAAVPQIGYDGSIVTVS